MLPGFCTENKINVLFSKIGKLEEIMAKFQIRHLTYSLSIEHLETLIITDLSTYKLVASNFLEVNPIMW